MPTDIPAASRPLIFDGHNDLVLRLMLDQVTAQGVADGLTDGHIDLPRAQRGGFGGGFFAIFVPSPRKDSGTPAGMSNPPYDLPLPDLLPQKDAYGQVVKGFEALEALEKAGAVTLCRNADEVETVLAAGTPMAAVIHIEGAEAIDADFAALHEFHARGLRSLGPVWSRPTIFGQGVPFRYPSDPDTGPGLTDAGKALVRECNTLKIMIDLSHLNAKGVDDVAAISDAPLVATHSNAWAISPHARNLTDRQLAMIAESDGMVGLNFASAFLRPDGKMDSDFGVDVMLRHLDYLIEKLGEDRVGMGSDFDGARVPDPIKDCAGLPGLRTAMVAHGFGNDLMEKLTHGNWLRVMRKTWGE